MIFINGKLKNSKNSLFSSMCKKFDVERKHRKKFREWLLYNTTIDPFVLSLHLEKEDIQEIEDYFEKLKEELIRQSKESGSRV